MKDYKENCLTRRPVLCTKKRILNLPGRVERSICVLFMFALWLTARPASAEEDTTPKRTPEQRALYEKGIELFDQELYAEAAEAFRQMQEISPVVAMYANLGECELVQEHYDLAMEAFTAYLKGSEDEISEDGRQYVEETVKKISPKVGRIRFEEEESLEIWVDDKLRASTPREEPLFVMPGERRVTLKKDSAVVFEETYVAEAEETIIVKRPPNSPSPPPLPPVEKTAQAQETPPAPETAESQEVPPVLQAAPETTSLQAKRSPLKPVGFALIGMGGAALVSGIVTGAKYVLENNSLEEKCPDKDNCSGEYKDLHQRVDRLAVATNVLLPLGGVLAATGIVLTVAGHKIENKNEHLSFTPYIGDGLTGIVVTGKF